MLRSVPFLLSFAALCTCDILFPKDTSIDFEFPPKFKRSNIAGLPDGHLRPLGWQKPAEGEVTAVDEIPDPVTFWETYVKDKVPLVIRNGVNKSSECFTEWDDKYLKSEYGHIDIDVIQKKPGDRIEPEVMSFKRFLLRYNLEDWYLVNTIPEEMLHGIPLMNCLMCGTFFEHLQEAEMWMSSGGTSSNLHYDADHNMHCLVDGRKDFIMYDPKHKEHLRFEDNEHDLTGHSKIDAEMVNMFENPRLAKISWKWTTLEPGDCIFIPAGHLHQVRSYGRSFSFTTLWTPTQAFNETGCSDLDVSSHIRSLADIDFVWKLYDGKRLINTDKYDDPETLRHHLMSLLREDAKLPRERFYSYFESAQNDLSREKETTPHAAFRQLDNKKKNYLTARNIKDLTEAQLKRVADMIRPELTEEERILREEL